MAEARSEEEEENMMRETREQVVRRQPNSSGGRPDRRKPEHRHSQGPLSSIRAAIKRTSTRSTSLSESSRERDRERDRDRDRRRPEITILSAEPLSSTSWFPGASGGFPPPPPPAAQIWGPTIPPSIQPPPSYEEVIREKTQEQVLLPSSSCGPSPSSSSSSSRPVSSITIATQTDPGSAPDTQDSQVKRPIRPPRPRLPTSSKPSTIDDITAVQSALTPCNGDKTPVAVNPPCCNLLADFCSPVTTNSAAQTGQWDQPPAVDLPLTPSTSSQVPLERPRPRPRSRLSAPPITNDVKVQTLVKLREDGFATLAARAGAANDQGASQGKYLQELLEAFSADDWGFPERRSDSSGNSQSESEGGEEEEEDMATLRARIQAFEQQQVTDGGGGDANRDFGEGKKPEPRPRPRLQGQPAKSVPPTVAPKPKNFSAKPSSKGFWEDSCGSTETPSVDLNPEPTTESTTQKSAPISVPQKPLITPKPQLSPETVPSSSPVPAPRPPPPKDQQTKPPPRPAVAPRASLGPQIPDKSPTAGRTNPTVQPKPTVEVQTEASEESTNQTVKVGSSRPGIPTKPAALTSLRRSSAPNLAPKPTATSPTAPDPNPVPPRPAAAAPATAPKPSGPAVGLKPPTTTPAPALRRGPVTQNKPETTNTNSSDPPLPPRPSSAKLLPLRPPPIKSTPGRPPPPTIPSTSTTTQSAPPTSKSVPAPSASTANQSSSSQTNATVSANQIQALRASKKGPPLPPRPKPGHPLFNSYSKQEVLIVLDDPPPSEPPSGEGQSQTTVTPLISQSQSLLDLDDQPEPTPDQESQSKPALEELSLSDSQSILPVQPSEQKERADPPPVSGPRCVALFDYEGEEEDELTFSQGDVIALLELIGQEWGRGQIHGRIGIFPLNFAEVVEPPPPRQETTKPMMEDTTVTEKSGTKISQEPQPEVTEWAVALFDFPAQTADDLSFHKGALIEVTQHVDAEWRRGRLEGREGLFPAAFTCQAQPITGQQPAQRGVAKFDFTAEGEDELTLKVGDIVTQVEPVDEQWILGVAGGKRGIVPKNYISLLS